MICQILIYVGNGVGNSREDIRLSAYGILLGEMIRRNPDMTLVTLGRYMDAFVLQAGQAGFKS